MTSLAFESVVMNPTPDVVTDDEIRAVDRQLQFIDLIDFHMKTVAEWHLIWRDVRAIFHRFTGMEVEDQADLGLPLAQLVEKLADLGDRIRLQCERISIEPAFMLLAANCSMESFEACIAYLRDVQHFLTGPDVSSEADHLFHPVAG